MQYDELVSLSEQRSDLNRRGQFVLIVATEC